MRRATELIFNRPYLHSRTGQIYCGRAEEIIGDSAHQSGKRQMSDTRDDEAENNLELEVSGLDEDATTLPADAAGETAKRRDSAHDNASRIITENDLRSHPRTHLLRAGVAILAVALAVAVILVSFPGIGERIGGPLTPFAPTPTIPPGSDIILLAHTVPWGELHLERPDLHPVPLGFRERYPAYRLPPGRHTLFYVAAPFSPMQCTISVPRRSDDNCKLATSRNPHETNSIVATRLIDAGASVKRLDPGARRELQSLLETGLSYPSLTIEPGTHYLAPNGQVAVARERLTVTMSMGAIAPPGGAISDDDGQPCGEICNMDGDQDYLTWKLLFWATPRWSYVSAGGATFTAYGDGTPAENPDLASVLWRNGKWILDTQNGLGAPCDFRAFIELLSEQTAGSGLDTFSQYGGNTPLVFNPANGCVFELYAQEHPSDHPRPEVLYRLGVLLATNADAQRVFPNLPVASAAERDIAQAIRTGAVQ
jgi:hypothetical protein